MEVTDEAGNYYEYTYDSENLMTRMVHGTTASVTATNYTYDKDGREIKLQMGAWERTTTYDNV